MKKKIAAIGIACGLSFNLSAEAPSETSIFLRAADGPGVEEVVAPMPGNARCSGNPQAGMAECWAPYRAVLVMRVRNGSTAILPRGTWL
jgi:hypothetical protein